MYRFKLKEIELGDTEINRGKKTTVSAIDDETGAIEWDVADVADFSSTYNALQKAKDFLDTLDKSAEKTKTDPRIDKFAIDMARLFNEFRSHVRKVYPEEYKKVLRLKEADVKDYNTQITNVIKANVKSVKTFAEEILRHIEKVKAEEPQGEAFVKNAKINSAINYLKSVANLKDEEEVNETALADKIIAPFDKEIEGLKLSKDKYQELLDKVSKLVKGLKEGEVDEGEGIGYMTPRAFDKNKKSTGAPDIYYYKLGFKPVPKTKPKGFEVKQLFEKTDRNEFQTKRIASFNEIEERLNRIYPLLSNAKDATAEYYNENPGSYAVVYSTDYIFELLDEVEEKLKKTEDK